MKKIFLSLTVLATLASCTSTKNGMPKKMHYEPTWESLAQYDETADWFKDAKFGIYAHWGVLSVPAYANDWYPRNMHVVGSDENKHQVATYGQLNKFGYNDFVPMFKAEKFDANEWADLMLKQALNLAALWQNTMMAGVTGIAK